jgi:hypothetical protein
LRLFVCLFLGLSGCSLYQSDGRKFLEKQALQFSRAAAANLQSCGAGALSEEWLKTSEDERVEVYASDARDFALRVVPRTSDGVYSCTYQFESVQEMIERTDSAGDLTLEQMALGLVP